MTKISSSSSFVQQFNKNSLDLRLWPFIVDKPFNICQFCCLSKQKAFIVILGQHVCSIRTRKLQSALCHMPHVFQVGFALLSHGTVVGCFVARVSLTQLPAQ